ncbi:MAG: hypothetical protein R3Y63_08090 [Eubacteriales bacterium]
MNRTSQSTAILSQDEETHLPDLIHSQKPFSVILKDDSGQKETLWMPYQENELKESLERMGVTEESQFSNVTISLGDHQFTSSLTELIEGQSCTMENLGHLNQLGEFLKDDFTLKSEGLATLIDATEISTLKELSVLMDNYQDLDFYQSDSGHTVIYNGNAPAMEQIVENMESQSQGMGGMQ